MSRYAVSITRRAQNHLAALPTDGYERIKKALVALADEPRPPGSKKLRGREGWRIRAGS
jgi:mRNA interferase RelE/StbE